MPTCPHTFAPIDVTTRLVPTIGTFVRITGRQCSTCGERRDLRQHGVAERLTQHDPATGLTFTVHGYRGTSLNDRRDLAVQQDPEGDVAKARLSELSR